MGELSLLIQMIREDKSEFGKLIDKMNPLISKYRRLLYKDEAEDVYSEMTMALWEAVTRLQYIDDDGKIMMFLNNALRMKFLELYKKSKWHHDHSMVIDSDELIEKNCAEEKFGDINFYTDIKKILARYDERKRLLFEEMLFRESSDAEIGDKYNISRQYVNRLRKMLYQELRDTYYEN